MNSLTEQVKSRVLVCWDMLEEHTGDEITQKLRNIHYEMHLRECGLTTPETRILRGDQIEVSNILKG